MQRQLLVDADIVVYRFACRSECVVDWGDGVVSAQGDVGQARDEANRWLDDITTKLKADDYLLVFGDNQHRSFRYDLFPDYKRHRTQGRPPVHRRAVEDMLRSEFPVKSKPNLEADDVMGILATNPAYLPGAEKIIVTIDKDLETVPGLHFNYHKDKEVRDVSVAEADYNHLYLTLVGDTADGFKGAPGIGPKKAAQILSEPPLWPSVLAAFRRKGLTAEDALLQARLARILRHEDYDYQRKEPILWQPK